MYQNLSPENQKVRKCFLLSFHLPIKFWKDSQVSGRKRNYIFYWYLNFPRSGETGLKPKESQNDPTHSAHDAVRAFLTK